jgi:hypothetical protein
MIKRARVSDIRVLALGEVVSMLASLMVSAFTDSEGRGSVSRIWMRTIANSNSPLV